MRGSLALTPIVLAARYGFHASDTIVFVLAAAALTPLAFLIGEATENVALHTAPAIGAFVNASLGNAPELIIALFAVGDGLPDVVRGSVTGSVVSTTLLVCGGAMLAGGDGPLHRSLLVQLGTVIAAVALFCIPAIGGFHGDPERHHLYLLTLPVAAVLLCLYVGVTIRNLRVERGTRRPPPEGAWSLRRAVVTLAGAAAATAGVSELLVGSLQSFGHSLGLSQFFVAAVIVALVGNAAEQGGAIVIARRGDPGLGAEIAISSASQIALFVCPAVALLSRFVGRPLPLSFRPVELATMGGGALVVFALVARGSSIRAGGFALVGAYAARGGRLRARRRALISRAYRCVGLGARERVAAEDELPTLDAKPLAAFASRADAEAAVGERFEHRGVHPRGRARRLGGQLPVPPGEDELVALRPPAAEDRTHLGRRLALGPPGGYLGRPALDRRARDLDAELPRREPRACVGERRRAHAGLAVHLETGEETGHRAAVPAEHPLSVRAQLDPESPAHQPALGIEHRLRRPHLLEARRVEQALAAPGQEAREAAEVGDGRPELTHRPHPGKLDMRLGRDRACVLLDEVPLRVGRPRLPARALESERREDPLLDEAAVGDACSHVPRPRRAARRRDSSSGGRAPRGAPARSAPSSLEQLPPPRASPR